MFEIIKLKNLGIELIDGDRGKNYPHQNELMDNGYCLFLSAKNVTTNGFDFEEKQFISKDKDRILRNGKLVRGDIVVTTRGTVGNVALYDESVSYENVRINSGMLIVRCDSRICKEYLYYVLRSEWFHTKIKAIQTGSAQPQLPKSHFEKMDIPVPSVDIQIRIADVIMQFDKKIACNSMINRNLSEQIAALYQAWFIDYEPFKNGDFVDSEVGEIPAGWRVEKLVDLCDTISKKHKFDKDELIFLNTGDVEDGKFLHANYSAVDGMPGQAKKSIKENDILYSEIRPINRHFAYVNFDAEDYVVSTKLMVIRSKGMDPRRLYQYLTSQSVIDELQLEAESRSGTFPQIRFENVGSLKMVVATDDVEKKYADLLQQFYAQIDKNVIENQRLVELRDSLLPKLMSGELDVSDLDI